MPTPAEISKLTAHARRARGLMENTAKVGEKAGPILDEYEKNLGNFQAHLDTVNKNSAALANALAEMGNAGPALEDAFREDDGPVSAKPGEVAHLPKVVGG